jgi:hypothetical protein
LINFLLQVVVGSYTVAGNDTLVGGSANYLFPFEEIYPLGINSNFLFVGRLEGSSSWLIGTPPTSADAVVSWTPAIVYGSSVQLRVPFLPAISHSIHFAAKDFDAFPFVYSLNNDEASGWQPILSTESDEVVADIGAADIAGTYGFAQGIFEGGTESEVSLFRTSASFARTVIPLPNFIRAPCNDNLQDGRALGLVVGKRAAPLAPFTNVTLVTQIPSGTVVQYLSINTYVTQVTEEYGGQLLFRSTTIENGPASLTQAFLLAQVRPSDYLLRVDSIKPKVSSVLSHVGNSDIENYHSSLVGPPATCQLNHDLFRVAVDPDGNYAIAAARINQTTKYEVQILDFSNNTYVTPHPYLAGPVAWQKAQFELFSDVVGNLPVLFNGNLFAFLAVNAAGNVVGYVGEAASDLLTVAGTGPMFSGAIWVERVPCRNTLLFGMNGEVLEAVIHWTSKTIAFNTRWTIAPGRTQLFARKTCLLMTQ